MLRNSNVIAILLLFVAVVASLSRDERSPGPDLMQPAERDMKQDEVFPQRRESALPRDDGQMLNQTHEELGQEPAPEQSEAVNAPRPPIYVNSSARFPGLDAPVIRVIGKSMIWSSRADRQQLPAEARYKSIITAEARKHERICINVEHWETDQRRVRPQVFEDNVSKLITLLRWAKEAAPEADIGIYSMVPVQDYWTPVTGDTDRIAAWHAANKALSELAAVCDTIYPSVYTFYEDQAGWATYASANVEQAKQYGKPVIAFVWPRYHTSNNTGLGMQPIPAGYWRFQLNTLQAAKVEGVIIWDGWDPWPFDAPWLVETRDYISGK